MASATSASASRQGFPASRHANAAKSSRFSAIRAATSRRMRDSLIETGTRRHATKPSFRGGDRRDLRARQRAAPLSATTGSYRRGTFRAPDCRCRSRAHDDDGTAQRQARRHATERGSKSRTRVVSRKVAQRFVLERLERRVSGFVHVRLLGGGWQRERWVPAWRRREPLRLPTANGHVERKTRSTCFRATVGRGKPCREPARRTARKSERVVRAARAHPIASPPSRRAPESRRSAQADRGHEPRQAHAPGFSDCDWRERAGAHRRHRAGDRRIARRRRRSAICLARPEPATHVVVQAPSRNPSRHP